MLRLIILFTLFTGYLFSQELTSSIDGQYFVEGIVTENIITLNNPSESVDGVLFFALDENNDTINLFFDDTETDGFEWVLDMGGLVPNTSLHALMFIGESEEGDIVDLEKVSVIKKPFWLKNGNIDNINLDKQNSTISFEGKYPIYNYNYTFEKNVKLLSDKSLKLAGNFVFDAVFDLKTGQGTIENNRASVILNILDHSEIKENIDYNAAELSFDKNLNISISASNSIRTKSVNWDSPTAKFPVSPGFSVELSASIEFYATLKGQIVIGMDGDEFGFIEDSEGRKTKIIGVVTGVGSVRGGLSVLGGVAKASASLIARANLGLGFDYVSLPSTKFNYLNGGEFDLTGNIEINLLESRWLKRLGFNPINVYSGYSRLYNTNFGDTNTLRRSIALSYDSLFNSKSLTFKDSGTIVLPEFKPQPTFCSNGDKFYATWIEVVNDEYQLLISEYNKELNSFQNRKVVLTNDFPKSNPKIGVLSDGSVLISWTQLKYNSQNINKNFNVTDLIKGQDIWFAFYDVDSDSIIQIAKLKDENSNKSADRTDGEASIAVGSDNDAMLTWVSLNESSNSSDIWFSNFKKDANEWTYTEPSKLIDLSGINSNVKVIYGDSSVAIATWINDPDGNVETNDNQIVYVGWNGDSWDSKPNIIADNKGNISYKSIALSNNSDKIVLAYASTIFDEVNTNQVNLEVLDLKTKNWDKSFSFFDSSSTLVYQNPQVSVSNNGVASFAYQIIEKYNSIDNLDNGEMLLFVNNLNTPNSNWVELSNNSSFCDTSTFIWDCTTGFGNQNSFYIMTQEYNNDGVVTKPKNGVLFGNQELSMVLRGVKINDDLTISDIDEPDTKTTQLNQIAPSYSYFYNYPNPFSDFTTFEFSLYEPAFVTLEIYNYNGTKVSTLVNQKFAEGVFKTNFDSGDLPEGIYHSRLTVNGKTTIGKIVIIK